MWALWPGAGIWYQATVLEKISREVAMRYFDDDRRTLKYSQVEVINVYDYWVRCAVCLGMCWRNFGYIDDESLS